MQSARSNVILMPRLTAVIAASLALPLGGVV